MRTISLEEALFLAIDALLEVQSAKAASKLEDESPIGVLSAKATPPTFENRPHTYRIKLTRGHTRSVQT